MYETEPETGQESAIHDPDVAQYEAEYSTPLEPDWDQVNEQVQASSPAQEDEQARWFSDSGDIAPYLLLILLSGLHAMVAQDRDS